MNEIIYDFCSPGNLNIPRDVFYPEEKSKQTVSWGVTEWAGIAHSRRHVWAPSSRRPGLTHSSGSGMCWILEGAKGVRSLPLWSGNIEPPPPPGSFSLKPRTPASAREKQQTNPNGDTITKYPASLPQNRQGHQQQGKSEKMSQLRGARGEVATECHVGTWHRDRERHQWENVWNAVCGLDTTDVSMLGPYCDKRIMLMPAVNNRGSGACVVWECPVLSLQLFHQSKTVWDFPGSPVVETLPSNVGGAGSIPGWGAKMIPHA